MVTAGKQLHETLTEHIPMAKGSAVTIITSCYFAAGDWDCTAVVQLIATDSCGQQEDGRQYHRGGGA